MELDINLQSHEFLNICVEGIKNQGKETKTNSELGGFWNVIQYLAMDGDITEDCDYKIKGERNFKSSTMKSEWKENRTILYIQESRIFMLYKM